jgi:16S rRNA processing protein RimM
MCDGIVDVEPGAEVFLKLGTDTVPVKIESLRHTPKGVLVKLSGIDDRMGAETLMGAEILIPVASLSELAEGEFYDFELKGLPVYDENDTLLGQVTGFIETAGNDVLIIDRGGREHLVPLVREHVVSISRGDRIVIRDIPWE